MLDANDCHLGFDCHWSAGRSTRRRSSLALLVIKFLPERKRLDLLLSDHNPLSHLGPCEALPFFCPHSPVYALFDGIKIG